MFLRTAATVTLSNLSDATVWQCMHTTEFLRPVFAGLDFRKEQIRKLQ